MNIAQGIGDGWDYNVGEATWGRKVAQNVRDRWAKMERNKKPQRPAWETLTKGDYLEYDRPSIIPVDITHEKLLGRVDDQAEVVAEITKHLGGESKIFQFEADGLKYAINVDAQHLGKHINKSRIRYIPLLTSVIENPYEIWMSFEVNRLTNAVALRFKFIKVIALDNAKDKGLVFVANVEKGHLIDWTFIPKNTISSVQSSRKGRLVYSRN